MKTFHLRTVAATVLLFAASLLPLPAADVTVDISSFAPGDPNAVLRQIELNVALKQYEKVLTELHEAGMEAALGPDRTDLTDDQRKQWDLRVQLKRKYLEEKSKELHEEIFLIIERANERLKIIEKEKAAEKTAPKDGFGSSPVEPHG